MRARMAEMNKIRTVHFNDLSMSDPYIYPDETTKTYYLTSSGGRMYKSKDLVMWEGPYNIIDISGTWMERAGFAAAAEIHKIGDYYYYAGTATLSSRFQEDTTCLTTRRFFCARRNLRGRMWYLMRTLTMTISLASGTASTVPCMKRMAVSIWYSYMSGLS